MSPGHGTTGGADQPGLPAQRGGTTWHPATSSARQPRSASCSGSNSTGPALATPPPMTTRSRSTPRPPTRSSRVPRWRCGGRPTPRDIVTAGGGVSQSWRRRRPALLRAHATRCVRWRWPRRSRAAAAARRAVDVDDDVTDVPGVAWCGRRKRAVEHQPAADTGGDHHAEQERRALPGAAPVLAQRHAQPVTGEPPAPRAPLRRRPGRGHRSRARLDVDRADGAGGRVDQARRGDPNAGDGAVGGPARR